MDRHAPAHGHMDAYRRLRGSGSASGEDAGAVSCCTRSSDSARPTAPLRGCVSLRSALSKKALFRGFSSKSAVSKQKASFGRRLLEEIAVRWRKSAFARGNRRLLEENGVCWKKTAFARGNRRLLEENGVCWKKSAFVTMQSAFAGRNRRL
jgi:hypothetical protein